MAEFDGLRAELYEQALVEFPVAREQDFTVMKNYLSPKKGEKILGFGEGNGFFVPSIAAAVGEDGTYLVTDPSKDQLTNLEKKFSHPAVQTSVIGAEGLKVKTQYDKAWSFGAFHHCPNQEMAMKKLYSSLKKGGQLVLCDVWRNTALAEHFDGPVAEYCYTGHDVKFLGDTYAKTIAKKAGFTDVQIKELPIKWIFDTKYDVGKFIYKLHAMTGIQGSEAEKIEQTLYGCEQILGLEKIGDKYELNWPMKVLLAKK